MERTPAGAGRQATMRFARCPFDAVRAVTEARRRSRTLWFRGRRQGGRGTMQGFYVGECGDDERRAECSCDPAMLAGASACFRSRTSPPFSLRELQGEGWHEEDRQAAAGVIQRSGRTRPAWIGGTRRPVSDARRMSATAPLIRATDHRCDSCGYQISTSHPFPPLPDVRRHSWRLIVVTHQVLVRAGKPHREVAS